MQYSHLAWHLSSFVTDFLMHWEKTGGNIPLDLRMKHLNNLLKTALKQLGASVSESAAQRIARALTALEHLIANVDNDCLLAS